MSLIATLVNANGLAWGEVSALCDLLAEAGALNIDAHWLEEGVAADIGFVNPATAGTQSTLKLDPRFHADDATRSDLIIQTEAERRRKLLIADMDSTMITVECIDELADYAGIKAEVAQVTEAAMRGELDFEGALRSRVALLKGLPERVIEDCLRERVRIMPGARELVGTLKANGGCAVLVSGGFTRFAEPVAAMIGFDRARANQLGIHNGVLDGTVVGDIVGAQTKRETLLAELQALGLPAAASLAIGDGANDIPMIEAAGLGIAYHAKPKTEAAASARIRHGDLSVALYAMGIPKRDWAQA